MPSFCEAAIKAGVFELSQPTTMQLTREKQKPNSTLDISGIPHGTPWRTPQLSHQHRQPTSKQILLCDWRIQFDHEALFADSPSFRNNIPNIPGVLTQLFNEGFKVSVLCNHSDEIITFTTLEECRSYLQQHGASIWISTEAKTKEKLLTLGHALSDYGILDYERFEKTRMYLQFENYDGTDYYIDFSKISLPDSAWETCLPTILACCDKVSKINVSPAQLPFLKLDYRLVQLTISGQNPNSYHGETLQLALLKLPACDTLNLHSIACIDLNGWENNLFAIQHLDFCGTTIINFRKLPEKITSLTIQDTTLVWPDLSKSDLKNLGIYSSSPSCPDFSKLPQELSFLHLHDMVPQLDFLPETRISNLKLSSSNLVNFYEWIQANQNSLQRWAEQAEPKNPLHITLDLYVNDLEITCREDLTPPIENFLETKKSEYQFLLSIEKSRKKPKLPKKSSSCDTQNGPSFLDTKTKGNTNLSQTYSLYHHSNQTLFAIDPRQYRRKVRDSFSIGALGLQLSVNQNNISTFPITPKKIIKFSRDDYEEEIYYGQETLTLQAEQWRPLTTLNTGDYLSAYLADFATDQLSFRYNESTDQIEISSKQALTITLRWVAEAGTHQEQVKPRPSLDENVATLLTLLFDFVVEPNNGIHPDVKEFILKIRQQQASETNSVDEAMEFFISYVEPYFAEFTHEPLSQTEPYRQALHEKIKARFPAVAEKLLDQCEILLQRKGVCRHGAFWGGLIAHYLQFPTRIIDNDIHAFVECQAEDGSWSRFDLAGAPATVHTTNANYRQIALPTATFTTSQHPWVHRHPMRDWFLPTFPELTECRTVNEWIHVLLEKYPRTLLLLEPSTPSIAFYQEVRRTVAENKKTFYLCDENDFYRYFAMTVINSQGQLETVDGPLKTLIAEGGVLVIDWRSMSAESIASFKSLLDTPPSLFGQNLHPSVQIINIADDKTPANEAFFSRVTKLTWPKTLTFPQHIESARPNPTPAVTEQDPVSIQNPLGNYALHGDHLSFQYSPIVTAMQQGLSQIKIAIFAEPNEWQEFKMRLELDDGVWINGEFVAKPKDFVIVEEAMPLHNADTADKIPFTPAINADIFYLNETTFPLLIEIIRFQNSRAHTTPGWLTQNNDLTAKRCIVQTGPLAPHQEAHLEWALRKNPEVFLVPVVSITPPTDAQNTLIFCEDPDGYALKLKQQQPDAVVESLYEHTRWSDIVETIELQSVVPQKPLQFTYRQQSIITALLTGKTVILSGTLSAALYQSLESLFANPPYLFINGQKIHVPGKLCLVTRKPAFTPTLAQHFQRVSTENMTMEDYAEQLRRENLLTDSAADAVLFSKLTAFLEKARVLHATSTEPHLPVFCCRYQTLRQMWIALKNPDPMRNNPIKDFFLHRYDHQGEAYAYLNVWAKYLFSPRNAETVEQRLRRDDKGSRYPETAPYHWRRLNALPINKLLQQWDEPALDVEFDVTPSRTDKQKYRLQTALTDPNVQAVVLQGPPGTGKTKAAYNLGAQVYLWQEENSSAVTAWREHTEGYAILLVDEDNTQSAEALAKIKLLLNECNSQRKIIFTRNPAHYVGRRDVDPEFTFFNGLRTVYFPSWSDARLIDLILEKKIPATIQDRETLIQLLLQVYRSAEQHLPKELLSVRDLEQLINRALYWHQQLPTEAWPITLYYAVVNEWQFFSSDVKVNQTLLKELRNVLGLVEDSQPQLSTAKTEMTQNVLRQQGLWLCPSNQQLLTIMQHALEMQTTFPAKRGLLIEGPSGIGKSTLAMSLLESQGYQPISMTLDQGKMPQHAGNYFIHFTADPADGRDQAAWLCHAAAQGWKVIIDELNLAPALEKVLGRLLTEAVHPQFFVFATQNSAATYRGCKELSLPLRNRLQLVYCPPYTKADFEALACEKFRRDHPTMHPQHITGYAKQATQVFCELRETDSSLNPRSFFYGLKRNCIQMTPALIAFSTVKH